jgi:hypothetical protein
MRYPTVGVAGRDNRKEGAVRTALPAINVTEHHFILESCCPVFCMGVGTELPEALTSVLEMWGSSRGVRNSSPRH